jgi:Ni,Fe-hydrogenase III component G
MKKLGINFNEKGGKFYSEVIPQNELKDAIPNLIKAQARLITATAIKSPTDEVFVYYHFEIERRVYTIKTRVKESRADSLSGDFPNISWIEREIQEFYKIDFKGQLKKPLLYHE